jgi:putative spermidine/putrescine transport system permease protein
MHRSITNRLAVVWSVIVGIILIAPVLVVIPLSFAPNRSFQFPPAGFSLRWYENIFTNRAWSSALMDSLIVAILVTIVATTIGTLAAIAIRWVPRGSSILRAFLLSPMVMPGIIAAVAMYSFFLQWKLNNSLAGFVLGHTVLAIPFVVIAVEANLHSYDRNHNRAAATLGSTPIGTFFRVTLPQIVPGVLSGAGFAFITSFDEVVLAIFIQGPSIKTLPVQMWNSVRQETDPTMSAVASLLVVIATVIILLVSVSRSKKISR